MLGYVLNGGNIIKLNSLLIDKHRIFGNVLKWDYIG